jgi:hypothetical protein
MFVNYQEANMKTSRTSMAALTITATTFLVMTASIHKVDAQAPGAATRPTMTAKLVDPEKKASTRAATVEVMTSGVELIDPATTGEKPVPGQGHLHYQVDSGPVIATTAAKLSFHELTPGAHTIVVMLAGNDHKPLGPQQRLTVTVPKEMRTTTGQSPSEPRPTGTSSQPTTPAPSTPRY